MFRERYHAKRTVTPAIVGALAIGLVLWRLRPFRVAVEGWSMAPGILPGDFLVATTVGRVRPGGAEFGRIAREKGLKAALDWRDGPFADYASAPAGAARPSGATW